MTLSISIITPTYNSSYYLEATLKSVLVQNYPALEYVVVDGNSSDGTQNIIRRYESQLSYWQSEPDKGMYEALQKGFARSTGEIMGYLNSDDLYLPHTLTTVSQIFSNLPQVQWISSIRPLIVNSEGAFVDVAALSGFHRDAFMRGENMLTNRYRLEMIQQESTFWRRNLWEKAGGTLDTSLKLAGDFELWARFYQHAELVGVRTILSGFRRHGAQLSAQQAEAYQAECLEVLERYHAKLHTPLSAAMRHLNPFFPKRLKKAASWLGINYKATNAVYDIAEDKWQLRNDYI
jgi:GT2 family glycosyltransferase